MNCFYHLPKFVIVVASCMGLSSCMTPRFYTPNRNPVPGFRNKGEIYIEAATNISNKFDGTLGYAFGKGLACYAGAGYSSESSSNFILKPYRAFECTNFIQNYGIGYYLNEEKSARFRFEIYADACLGKYDIVKYPEHDDYYRAKGKTGYISGQYRRFGMLINIGRLSKRKTLQSGYTCRLSRLDFHNSTFVNPESVEEEIARLYSKPNYFLIEHGYYIKAGRGPVRFTAQFAVYHGLYTNSESKAVQQLNMNYIFGIAVNTNVLSRKKDSK